MDIYVIIDHLLDGRFYYILYFPKEHLKNIQGEAGPILFKEADFQVGFWAVQKMNEWITTFIRDNISVFSNCGKHRYFRILWICSGLTKT